MIRHTCLSVALALVEASLCMTAHAQPPHDKPGKAHQRESEAHHAYGGQRPSVSEAIIREVLRDYGIHGASSQRLPPGIQKNLQRGKPLPPGIAKKLDPRLVGRLPDYPGYEWRQVGRDLILVAVATGIIEAILNEVL